MDLSDLTRELEALRDEALAAIAASESVAGLEAIDLDVLGKKGRLTGILRGIGGLPPDDRPKVGAIANTVREAVEARPGGARRRSCARRRSTGNSRPRPSTSRRPGGRSGAARSIRSTRRSARSPRSSASSAS